ncbi:MAG: alpha/beta hydrolase [Spirochaetaceae bacterium]
MYRYAEYLHFPEIVTAAFLDRLRHRRPATRLTYGENRHQEAYFLRPDSGHPKRPLLVFVHGGGWRRGHPKYFRFVGRFFARHGYPVLLLGYRLGPAAQFDDQLSDLHEGIRTFLVTPWARANQPRSAIVVGQSAGGHLGAHLAYAPLPSGSELTAPKVAGFVSISGVLSFERAGWRYLEGLIKNTAADPALRRRADARQALESDRGPIPALLIHGEEDRIVPPEVTTAFARRYEERFGRPPALLYYPWAKHNELALLFLERRPRASQLLMQWLQVATEQREKDDAA